MKSNKEELLKKIDQMPFDRLQDFKMASNYIKIAFALSDAVQLYLRNADEYLKKSEFGGLKCETKRSYAQLNFNLKCAKVHANDLSKVIYGIEETDEALENADRLESIVRTYVNRVDDENFNTMLERIKFGFVSKHRIPE